MLKTPKAATRNYDFESLCSKCVCQICNCGKHHCPPKYVKFEGETTNHHDYRPYQIKSQRYQTEPYQIPQRRYDPEVLKTSYNKDYEPYQLQPHLNPIKYEYTQKKTPFYDETEYKKSYVPFQIATDRPATCAPIDYRNTKNRAKFDGTTTYNVEFSPKHVDRVPYSPVKYERKKIPFEGQTSYNSEYIPYQIQKKKPLNINYDTYQGRKNKFTGQTRYQEEYKPYEIQKQTRCPVDVMPPMPKTCSPGKSHLTYSPEKKRWE